MVPGLRLAAAARLVVGSLALFVAIVTLASQIAAPVSAFQTGGASLPPPATGSFAYNSFVPSLLTGTTYVDPIFGETSYANRIVLPASGPNSRKTVVSWMNSAPSGTSVPLRKTAWPYCACW